MAFSKACKFITLGAIGIATVAVIVVVYHVGRSAICPEKGFLFHPDTKKCFLRETKGPCHNNLILLDEKPKHPNGIGQCSCPYTRFNRSLLYHEETKQCYFVFTQAYCESGSWLTVHKEGDNKGKPLCEANQCIQHSPNRVEDSGNEADRHYHGAEFVPIKGGGCAELGTHVEGCPEGSAIEFRKGLFFPSCVEPPKKHIVSSGTLGVPPASCPLGSYPSIMGRCQPDFQFDFE